MRHNNFIPKAEVHHRGYIPHWYIDNASYFVTFRLRDSLPREVTRALYHERMHILRSVTNEVERARLDRAFAICLDRELDASRGSCLLREHGDIVAGALKHFHGERYDLHAWCVMPNHVHVLIQMERGHDLPTVLHSWKSYTSQKIGKGVIWQKEYFDRVIRSAAEFSETRMYIRGNPVKAGLRDWKWVG